MKSLKTLRDFLHGLVGMPSYERYLEHVSVHHPGETPLTYEAFYKRAQDRRYNGRRQTCC